MPAKTHAQLLEENEDLLRRLEEAEATVFAIRNGDVDAVVVYENPGEKVYTLEGADQPYRLLVESMQQGAATLHRDGTILYCNRSMAEMLKTAPERVVGRSLSEFAEQTDAALLATMIHETAATETRGEVRLRRGDREVFSAELALNSLPLKDAICVVVTDLTGQKQYEELMSARERLAENDRRKDEFLAMLAHELRNPLAPILTGLHLIAQPGTDGAAVQEIREMMQRQVAQLSRLVDDLLDVSRITRGKVELKRTAVDLAEIVSRAVETSRPLIEAHRHQLNIRLPGQAIRLDADPIRLVQVVANLITNAAKYQEDGGQIGLIVEREEEVAVLSVSDRGIGISADKLSAVFELFTQIDAKVDRAQGGLGIGLTLVKRLVEMHGGSVQARSGGLGQGSEFIVRLPLADELAAAPEYCKGPTEVVPGPPQRVLVVDDNRDAAETMGILLRLSGHQVRVAHNGSDAIETADQFHPQLIFLDLGMPGMSGLDVCRSLRQQHADAVLVAVTGWGQDEDRRRSRDAGFDEHLVKPVDPRVLLKLVSDLDRRAAQP